VDAVRGCHCHQSLLLLWECLVGRCNWSLFILWECLVGRCHWSLFILWACLVGRCHWSLLLLWECLVDRCHWSLLLLRECLIDRCNWSLLLMWECLLGRCHWSLLLLWECLLGRCHWLLSLITVIPILIPIRQRIDYKLATIVHHFLHNACPKYLSSLLHTYTPTRQLRSASLNFLSQPRAKIALASRGFRRTGPSIWNFLPPHLRSIDTYTAFKSNLKSHLFCSASISGP